MAQKVANASMTIDIPNDELIIKDETNYAGQGNVLDNSYYGYILSFKSPQGYTIYSNPGGGGDPKDFDYSFITPTDSKSFTIPKLGNGEIETGEYILEMIIYGGGDTFEITKSFNFDGYDAPDPSLTFTVDCITPKFKVVDSTDYAQPKLNSILPVVGESPTTLTLSSPKTGVADIVENSSVLETSSFYTTVNTVSLVRTIYYEISASELLYLTDDVSYEDEKNVVCVQDLCSMYAIVEAINKDYTNALSTNHTLAKQELWPKWIRAVGLLIMVRQALSCGNEDALAAYSEEIEDFRDECETEQNNIEPVLVQAWSATDNNTVTVAYAIDLNGAGFTLTPTSNTVYFAILAHNKNYTPLQSDFDGKWKSVQSDDISQAFTNKTIDADNNNISNLKHGQEVDNPSSGVHGVAGSVVGTSGAQSLTQKTLDALSNNISANRVHAYGTPVSQTSISKGAPIEIVGYNTASSIFTITRATKASKTYFGVAAEYIPSQSSGKFITSGVIDGINTDFFSIGDLLYIDGVGADFVNIPPTSGNVLPIAIVIKVGLNGSILVLPANKMQIASEIRSEATGLSASTVEGALEELLSALAGKISKDLGIELEANGVAKFYDGDLDNLTNTGPYRGGFNVTNKSPDSDSREYYYVIKHSDDFIIQLAFTFSNNNVARRNRINGVWTSWVSFLDTSDKTELTNLINAKQSTSEKGQASGYASLDSGGKVPESQLYGDVNLDIDDIDLRSSSIWDASTKTLDLTSKNTFGLLNFNTPAPTYTLTNISSNTTAKASFSEGDSSIPLIQEGSRVVFQNIVGDANFTQLNTGVYIARNVDYVNKAFDIRKGDDSGFVDTSFTAIVGITDITSSTNAQVTVSDASLLSELQEIQIRGASGMEFLDNGDYVVQDLDVGANTFNLVESGTLDLVDTTGFTYSPGSGDVGETPTYTVSGSTSLENDIVDISIEKIEGLDNGDVVKFSANADNKIEFVKEPLATSIPNDIVGSESLILEENKVFELLRNKDLNWVKTEFEAS